MRDIKFRGKRLDNGEWIKGNSIVRVGDGFFICDWTGVAIKKSEFYNLFTEVAPATVGQYTGLKDKNGREIYEGDIIGGSNGSINGWEWPFKSEIKWNDEECGFNTPIWGDMDSTHYYNVLGNIHDNPDLLKTE
uniref:YopX family protein n=1 Tax=Alistipes shahii TaxID=328814 RepID=UPI00402508C2